MFQCNMLTFFLGSQIFSTPPKKKTLLSIHMACQSVILGVPGCWRQICKMEKSTPDLVARIFLGGGFKYFFYVHPYLGKSFQFD